VEEAIYECGLLEDRKNQNEAEPQAKPCIIFSGTNASQGSAAGNGARDQLLWDSSAEMFEDVTVKNRRIISIDAKQVARIFALLGVFGVFSTIILAVSGTPKISFPVGIVASPFILSFNLNFMLPASEVGRMFAFFGADGLLYLCRLVYRIRTDHGVKRIGAVDGWHPCVDG
jgi:hypothetical protein